MCLWPPTTAPTPSLTTRTTAPCIRTLSPSISRGGSLVRKGGLSPAAAGSSRTVGSARLDSRRECAATECKVTWSSRIRTMGFNVKRGTMASVYAPTLIDGYFSGACRVNNVTGYSYFVQVHDRGQPGSNDDFSV